MTSSLGTWTNKGSQNRRPRSTGKQWCSSQRKESKFERTGTWLEPLCQNCWIEEVLTSSNSAHCLFSATPSYTFLLQWQISYRWMIPVHYNIHSISSNYFNYSIYFRNSMMRLIIMQFCFHFLIHQILHLGLAAFSLIWRIQLFWAFFSLFWHVINKFSIVSKDLHLKHSSLFLQNLAL